MATRRKRSSRSRSPLSRIRWDAWSAIGAIALVLCVIGGGYGVYVSATREAPSTNAVARQPGTASKATSVAAIDLDGIRSAVFIGDSWVYGVASEPATDGFAYRTGRLMGWNTEVHGWGSVGYINTGRDNGGTYAQRWSQVQPQINPDLVVIEGSLNDSDFTPNEIRDAAGEFVAQLKEQFPGAQLLIVGPASPSEQWRKTLPNINFELKKLASTEGVGFINPTSWLTTDNYTQYTDPSSPHLNTVGHEYYANQLVAALRGDAATN